MRFTVGSRCWRSPVSIESSFVVQKVQNEMRKEKKSRKFG